MQEIPAPSITHPGGCQHRLAGLLVALVAVLVGVPAAPADELQQREQFKRAWTAASKGDRRQFERLGPGLEDYILYPYYQYEHYRANRSRVAAAEMAVFLEQHADWSFAPALKTAWLKTLGKRKRWRELVQYAGDTADTELRCYLARARIELGEDQGLLPEVQSLWTAGKSQPGTCDPAFAWLQKQGGITPALAMERIRLSILAGNPRFALYLARFVPATERQWIERWYALSRSRYRRLEQAAAWPDAPLTRMLGAASLQRLARHDADLAMRVFRALDGHFTWSDDEQGVVLREIALRGAVSMSDEAASHMRAVPDTHVDTQLLEWWARLALAASVSPSPALAAACQ